MIPLVTTKEELTLARSWVEEAIVQHGRLPRTTAGNRAGKVRKISRPKVTIGTMIETPRAALVANELAEVSDFFSFGTNDLTQMTFGFSRDDVESRLMPQYLAAGLLKRNPFESIDAVGVGELVRMAAKRGRKTKRSLKLGVCGEHGGDPDSIAVFYAAGLDYVSCSPYRIPIARLACAQAIIGGSSTDSK
jgi:pyruvate,orthophosphate dikinase